MNDEIKEQISMNVIEKEDEEKEVFSTGVSIDDATKEESIVEQEESIFKKVFFHNPKKYIVAILIGLVVIVIALWIKGANYLKAYVDGTFIAAFVLIAAGMLSILTSKGSVDIFSYSTKYVYNRFRSRPVERYHEYTSNKMEKRSKNKFSYVPYFVCGALYFVISLILFIVME